MLVKIKRGHYGTKWAKLGSFYIFLENNKILLIHWGETVKKYRHDDIVFYFRNVFIVPCKLNNFKTNLL